VRQLVIKVLNMSYILVAWTFIQTFRITRNMKPKYCTYRNIHKTPVSIKSSKHPIHFISAQSTPDHITVNTH